MTYPPPPPGPYQPQDPLQPQAPYQPYQPQAPQQSPYQQPDPFQPQAPHQQNPYQQQGSYQAQAPGTPQEPQQAQFPGTPQWQAPQPPPPSGTSGLAITSLVLAFFAPLIGLILGIVALVQVRKSGQNGKGLAIAAIAISSAWFLVIAGIFVVAILNIDPAKRDDSGKVTDGGDVSAQSLKIGDCVNDLEETTRVTNLPVVPCTERHQGEVYAIVDVEGSIYPGEDAIFEKADLACEAALDSYVAADADLTGVGIFYLYPTASSWRRGDREITCMTFVEAGSVGSIKG